RGSGISRVGRHRLPPETLVSTIECFHHPTKLELVSGPTGKPGFHLAWVVAPRKALGGLIRFCQFDQSKRRERYPMQAGDRAMLVDGGAVACGAVAHMGFEAVAGVMAAAPDHHPIAHHLGDDRGGGDRLRALVAPYQCAAG